MRNKALPRRKPLPEDIQAVQTFSANVHALLAVARNGSISQGDIAREAGVSLRTLGYQIAGKTAPTLRTIQAFAQAFGLEAWQLLLPDLPAEVALNPKMRASVRATIRQYLNANADDRDLVDKMAAKLPPKVA